MASTKTLAVLADSELRDGQMKQVEFGEKGKVLLSRIGGQVHATSAFCTHYGAPLQKGVLESSGRVVCPWHGACFNVCTGDIEDAPAVDSLHSFVAEVKEGQIWVTAEEGKTLKDNMAREPSLSSIVMSEGASETVVIVGGGAGTMHAIESLRLHGFGGTITVISSEKYAPIDRTKLSKTLMTDLSKLQWRSLDVLKNKYKVNYREGQEVTAVDTIGKNVTVNGAEIVKYDKLILAPGSKPKKLPIDGSDLTGVFLLRQILDVEAINGAIAKGKNLVVIGSSFIGMELVVAVQKKELGSTHVVGMTSVPFEAVLGKDVGAGIMKFHEKNGVKFHMSSGVSAIRPREGDASAVGSVVLQDGTEIPADIVVFGVGVRPATDFVKGSKLESALQPDGGLKVDSKLRVEGFPDVYAIGDVAVYPQSQDGTVRRIEHWNVASNHGRAVGETIGRRKDDLAAGFEKVPIFWSAQGQQLRYCGVGEGFDDVIIKGNPDEMKFGAFYVKGGKVIAVASMQMDPLVTKSAELLRLGLMPSPEEIRAGKDLLSIDIATKKL